MSGRKISVTMTEPQARFFNKTCKYPAFVGGFGSGKTETMLNCAFRDARQSAKSLIALYEPTYDLIRLILAPRMDEKLVDFGIRHRYNKTENIIYTSSPGIGDFVMRTLDNPTRIVGYESYRAHVDEIDTLKEAHAQAVWEKIIARNRQTLDGSDIALNRVSAYTTPEGFRFVYKMWQRNPSPGYEMVKAATASNPFLPADYVESLRNTYDEHLINAYLEGEFVNLTSGTVYHAFDRTLNGSHEVVMPGETLYIGMDFNVGKMAAIVHVKRGNTPHAVDEITDGYDTPEVIKTIQERFAGHQIYVYPDASGKNRKSNSASLTDIQQLKDAGFIIRVDPSNPPVKDRVNSMNSMFCNAHGERRYFVNVQRCPVYTECLEQQVWAPSGEPDKSAGKDHCNDAGGYFIVKDYPLIRPVAAHSTQLPIMGR